MRGQFLQPHFVVVVQSELVAADKDPEPRRLRELPWREKLELLERLRDRQSILRQTKVREPETQRMEGHPDHLMPN